MADIAAAAWLMMESDLSVVTEENGLKNFLKNLTSRVPVITFL